MKSNTTDEFRPAAVDPGSSTDAEADDRHVREATALTVIRHAVSLAIAGGISAQRVRDECQAGIRAKAVTPLRVPSTASAPTPR